MSSETDKIDKAIRIAAEPYKSFPKAVAAVVRAMFDLGAQSVLISFERGLNTRPYLCIVADRDVFSWSDLDALNGRTTSGPLFVLAAIRIHHGVSISVSRSFYELYGLGQGKGVNPHQKRTAGRLLHSLPALLSPFEAYHTTLVDEDGQEHALLKGPPAASRADGFEVDLPESFIWCGQDGLIVKFGAVRVPMQTLLSRAQLDLLQLDRLNILTHPWLQGILEVRIKNESLGIPVPTVSAQGFDSEDFGDWDMATELATVLLHAGVVDVAIARIGKVIDSAVSDFSEHQEFVLGLIDIW